MVGSPEKNTTIAILILSILLMGDFILFREVTASIYDLMGHPGGERERSEAAEQHITRRADLLFQVISMVMIMMMVMMVKNTIRCRD